MARRSDGPVQVGTEGLPMFDEHQRIAAAMMKPLTPTEHALVVAHLADHRKLARTTDPETSHLAAASMRSAAHTQRLAILEYLGRCADYGATADETDLALGWRSGRAGRRYGELVTLGLVRVASVVRKTSTGREAQVYTLPIFAS